LLRKTYELGFLTVRCAFAVTSLQKIYIHNITINFLKYVSATSKQAPEILKQVLTLRGSNKPAVFVENRNSSSPVKWTNDGFWSEIVINASSNYVIKHFVPSAIPNYIKNYSFGIKYMSIHLTLVRGNAYFEQIATL
jgi:hypothetical protein